MEDKIPGGLAKGMSLTDIAKHHKIPVKSLKTKLEQGIKIEMEHTTDKDIAREIAMDHIYEDPNYYSKLKKLETEGTCGYNEDVETGEIFDTPGGLNENKYIDWDKNYGKTFKIVHTPKGAQSGGEWSPDLVSVVTPENSDAWTDWKEIAPESLKNWKKNWNNLQKSLGDHKYGQITRSMDKLGIQEKKNKDPFGLNQYARELAQGLEEKLIQNIIHTPNSYKNLIPEITKFMLNKGMNLRPLPKVKFIEDDKENSEDILGRTAFYNPNEKSISLFTLGRHPKDILRSFCHEMIHHMQNVEGRLPAFTTTNTQEDSTLNDIEEEAHKLGSMTMREFEDTIKK